MGEWVRTFTVLTTTANELVAEIHDRMPVMIPPESYDRWLSTLDPDPRDLLVPYPAGPMTIWPISTRVNKPANDDEAILEPVGGFEAAAIPGHRWWSSQSGPSLPLLISILSISGRY
jgi:putative SOS response-associated peptidase YedK